MPVLRRFAAAGPLGEASPPAVPPPPRETKPPKPPRSLRTPPQCQMDGIRTGGRDLAGGSSGSSRAPNFPPAPSATDYAGAGYPPEKELTASGSDAHLQLGAGSPLAEEMDGSSRASSRQGGQGTLGFGGGRGSTASVGSSSVHGVGGGGAASSTASTRDPSPRPGSGTSMTGSGSAERGRAHERASEPRGFDGSMGAPVTWKTRPQDADTLLRNTGQGGRHLNCRRSNLAKIREIQGLPPKAAKSVPGTLLSSIGASP